jgi:2-polyprenyl-3-methyl-5-hydroxy-6-metoxy-1,4-benzoquinol methylase
MTPETALGPLRDRNQADTRDPTFSGRGPPCLWMMSRLYGPTQGKLVAHARALAETMNRKSRSRALKWLGPISVLVAGLWVSTPVRAQSGSASPSTQRKTSTPYSGDLSIFEVPGRGERLQINRVMDMLGIEPGKSVADIGAGSGWFTVRAARRVTGSGRVYAVDINPEAIHYIDQRAKKEQLQNIKTILSKPDDPQVPAISIDAVLLLKTYHEVAQPVVLLRNLRSSLKPGAKIGIIDRNGNGENHGVSKDVVVREAAQAGYELRDSQDFVKADGMNYFLIFTAKPD